MARKSKEFTVGADCYEVTQLGAVEGLELYHELLRAVGPTVRGKLGDLGALIAVGDGDEAKTKTSLNLAGLLIEIVESIPRDLMRELRIKFSETTKVKVGELFLPMKEGDIFDQHFAGRISAMQSWIITCMKHNFSDFLPSEPSPPSSAEK